MPSTHMRCMITANRRARATIAYAAAFTVPFTVEERQGRADMRTHLIHRPARDIIPPLGGNSSFLLLDLIPHGFHAAAAACSRVQLSPRPAEQAPAARGWIHEVKHDLLELDGEDLQRTPIEERKRILAKLVSHPHEGIAFNEHYTCCRSKASSRADRISSIVEAWTPVAHHLRPATAPAARSNSG